MSDLRCRNLSGDRAIGEYWERRFCAMAANHGRSFTPQQIGRFESATAAVLDNGLWHNYTLPDVTIWTRPGEHHELKHKDRTRAGMFGLERYRLDALLWFSEETGQRVYYTIHDYSLVPLSSREERKACRKNCFYHWLTADVCDLQIPDKVIHNDTSWVAGERRDDVTVCYWRADRFWPLALLW